MASGFTETTSALLSLATPMPSHSCGSSWTDSRWAHCAVCHETFVSDRAFDAHRATPSETGPKCHHPSGVALRDGSPAFAAPRSSESTQNGVVWALALTPARAERFEKLKATA